MAKQKNGTKALLKNIINKEGQVTESISEYVSSIIYKGIANQLVEGVGNPDLGCTYELVTKVNPKTKKTETFMASMFLEGYKDVNKREKGTVWDENWTMFPGGRNEIK